MSLFDYTPQCQTLSAPLYPMVAPVVSESDWAVFAPYVLAIQEAKQSFDGLIVSHFYVSIEITQILSDFVGDFDEIVNFVRNTQTDRILFCGGFYLAQSLAIVCPDKKIYVADTDALSNIGNSLSVQDIAILRARYPDHQVLIDINMPLSVKKVADCCVSDVALSRALETVFTDNSLIVLPDKNIVLSMANRLNRSLVSWDSAYSVRDRYTLDHIRWCREQSPTCFILAHHGCNPAVVQAADAAGSTRALLDCIGRTSDRDIYILDENSVIEKAILDYPDTVKRLGIPYQCHQVKRITLPKVLTALDLKVSQPLEISDEDKALKERHHLLFS